MSNDAVGMIDSMVTEFEPTILFERHAHLFEDAKVTKEDFNPKACRYELDPYSPALE